jgi:ATP-dependent RNA helicase DeaD
MTFPATHAQLARALAERDYDQPTAVQEAVLAEKTAGRDLLVSAQTGSGKTVAYGLAIAGTILGEEESFARAAEPLALIVAPTRELALQVHRELEWLYAKAGGRVVSCVGGMDPKRERRLLGEGAHIVVGTPGRLRDHLERGGLDASGLKAVVLDEADEMLDLGFREDLEFILQATPAERRTLLFSATLPKTIVGMAKRYQRDALRLKVAGGEGGHADIEYRAIRIAPNEVEHAVVNLLRLVEAPTAIVFCNTREAVRHLHATLQERGFSVVSLSGEMSQSDRNHALQGLRDGRARVCVATDVAARGIDVPSVGLVVHADLPHDAEVLQHRSGRTGRAGRKGISALLVPISRRRRAEQLLREAGLQPPWSGPPSVEEVRRVDEARMMEDPLLVEAPAEEDLAAARALLQTRPAEEIAAALVRIYRSKLPEPEEVFDPGDPRGRERERDAPRRDQPRERGAPRSEMSGGTWFRLDIGRQNNADPRWLLPLICRRGGVTRQDIGAIRIFDRETKFEVSERAARRFADAVRRSDAEDVAIEALAPRPEERPRGKPPFRKPSKPRDEARAGKGRRGRPG